MCNPAFVVIGATVVAGALQARGQQQAGKAAKQQGRFIAQVASNNALLADRSADDALARGAEGERRERVRTRQLIARQRVAFAGANIVVDEGTALDITVDQSGIGELDALTVRNNAEREAAALRAQAANFSAEGQLALLRGNAANNAARIAALGTIVTTAGSAFSQGAAFSKAGAFAKPAGGSVGTAASSGFS